MKSDRRRTARQDGFTVLELMIAVAVIGILASMAVYSGVKEQKRAVQTEVITGLTKIREAQTIHYLEKGVYATSFADLLFRTDQGTALSDTVYKGKVYQYTLSNPWGPSSYYVSAVGNVDGDDFLDMWVLEAGRP